MLLHQRVTSTSDDPRWGGCCSRSDTAAIDIRSFQRSSVNLRISSESQSFTNRANCLSPNWSDGDVPRIPLRSASLGRIGGQPDRR